VYDAAQVQQQAKKVMTYVALHFDERTASNMRAAVGLIADGSAFCPSELPFHIPIMGSLHQYPASQVQQQCVQWCSEPCGRFIEWAIVSGELRAVLELDDITSSVEELRSALPCGRLWDRFHVTLGNVEAIDASACSAFLCAIKEAFPIDSSQYFTAHSLHLYEAPSTLQVTPAVETGSSMDQLIKANLSSSTRRRSRKRPSAKKTSTVRALPAQVRAPISTLAMCIQKKQKTKPKEKKKRKQKRTCKEQQSAGHQLSHGARHFDC
jgi:hypothetical protein